jgi:predicted ribosomally synthesized peptide with SipW-like signal peptide
MKKIGLIVMALILALGAVGVGYAMWSDTVTVQGTVSTGSVDIDIIDVSETYIYKVVVAYEVGDPPTTVPVGEMLCSGVPLPLDPDEDGVNNLLPVASATTKYNDDEAVELVNMTFTNIFPTPSCPIYADVKLHYRGTVPAHVKIYEDYVGDDLSPYLVQDWWLSTDDGETWQLIRDPSLIQLHECNLLWLWVYLDPDALQDAGIDAQGLNGGFVKQIFVHQWNEEP